MVSASKSGNIDIIVHSIAFADKDDLGGPFVDVSKNGKHITSIKGLAFKKAVFGIWLCDDPADDDLKEGMLGLD